MYYSLFYKEKIVIKESELGAMIENLLFESALSVPNDTCRLWCENLSLIGADHSSVVTDSTINTWVSKSYYRVLQL
ncbi:hypothetical protein [uncultured Bacteroides sp.]|uniref:hypothetical protein n=1 Tax=uncultured Bacteroides sp. TaxID=162156 RepID=UPI002AABED74|nr:hypothetical protein [uncultured Bacteroides sp.]